MINLPIYFLSERTSDILSKINSNTELKGFSEGLNPVINYIDKEGKISCTAGIDEIPKESRLATEPFYRRVTISAVFAQGLWMLCDAVLRLHDSCVIARLYDEMSPAQKSAYHEELKFDTIWSQYQKPLLNIEEVKYQTGLQLLLLKSMFDNEFETNDYKKLNNLDLKSQIATRVNSLYSYAMSFILLHELAHHTLEHDLSRAGSVEEEMQADSDAFWKLYCDLDGSEKTTAMYGTIIALVSQIFYNYKLIDDKIHPLPIERIFYYYDIIKDENLKYGSFLLYSLYAWYYYTGTSMPAITDFIDETQALDEIKKHLIKIEKANNICE